MKRISLSLAFILLFNVMLVGCQNGNQSEVVKQSHTSTQEEIKKGSKLIVHYYRYEGDYDNWSFWIWPEGREGKAYNFTGEDDFGKIAEIEFNEKLDRVGIIPRLGNWEAKDVNMDRFIDLKGDVTEVWMIQGTEKIFYNREEANIKPKIRGAFLDTKRDIFVELTNKLNLTGNNNENFIVKVDGKEVDIEKVEGVRVKQENINKKGYELLVDDTKIKFIFSPTEFGYKHNKDDDVYVIGDFNNYQISDEFKLEYDKVFDVYKLLKDVGNNHSINFKDTFCFVVNNNDKEVFKSSDLVVDKYLGKVTNLFKITLKEDVDFTEGIVVDHKDFKEKDVVMRKVLELPEFTYTGNDLGANYNKDYTTFKVWSPVAEEMKVVIYDKYNDNEGKVYLMNKGENGVWELTLDGDYKNKYYNYKVTIDGIEKETPDPYAKGATANGEKGMIVDFESINPEGWENHKLPESIKPTEAILYEMHVRDFSVDENSGITYKGKYLAFTEEGTKGPNGVSTGLDHLKELGITHVHLLPVYDFASVDETKEGQYNWGYDPYLYNVPEGSYATDPYDGTVRIREFKEMVKTLHENNIGVVMDVVFNHTYSVGNSPFDILVPKYYYRTAADGSYTNGSGCGNETASEKPMMRKFIIDSVKFWATEYKIDGFRFDLMALHDIDTMKEVVKELKKINPNIIIYGEPWTGGNSALSPMKQLRKGKQKGLGLAVFNDNIRNAIKGDNDGTGVGFVNGGYGLVNEVKKGIVGSIRYNDSIQSFTDSPTETINYVSSHDNLCLFDKFEKSNKHDTEEARERMNKLALSIVLTSQGIPFIQGGTEILRTKQGVHNSYNSGDEINKIDWSRKSKYKETFDYIKGLIKLRKSQKVMTLDNAEDIRNSLQFIDTPNNSVGYLLNSNFKGDYKHLIIIHNANREEIKIKLPLDGEWNAIANEYEVNQDKVTKGQKSFTNEVTVPALSTYILYQN
ncbi:type I pullulanase [Caldisalinibacter kiritimatiensis]|uniref:pullulanase n=1 Tax=Caldisalinibacter kiritimatiensis TaxID=1304284 RepID=R1AVV7_9FIRM|nr:type I pullulanase [Caldisalinibacter kiritimatiensis]EOD00787.1 Pullulanase [Caldisalinibacter kiritimatiensis]